MQLERSDDKLAQAIAAVKEGRKSEAEKVLKAIVREDPQSVDGWLWLGASVSSPRETLYCLERVLEIDPKNRHAQAGIQWARTQGSAKRSLAANPLSLPSGSPGANAPGRRSTAPLPGDVDELTIPRPAPWTSTARTPSAAHVVLPEPAELALEEPTSHFFPNLIVAVLSLTLVLGVLIIAALLRAWLAG